MMEKERLVSSNGNHIRIDGGFQAVTNTFGNFRRHLISGKFTTLQTKYVYVHTTRLSGGIPTAPMSYIIIIIIMPERFE